LVELLLVLLVGLPFLRLALFQHNPTLLARFYEGFLKVAPGSERAWWALYNVRKAERRLLWRECVDILGRGLDRCPWSRLLVVEYSLRHIAFFCHSGDPTHIDRAATAVRRYEEVLEPGIETAWFWCDERLLRGDVDGAAKAAQRGLRFQYSSSESMHYRYELALRTAQIPTERARGLEMLAELARPPASRASAEATISGLAHEQLSLLLRNEDKLASSEHGLQARRALAPMEAKCGIELLRYLHDFEEGFSERETRINEAIATAST
jgi:hypothetical protein